MSEIPRVFSLASAAVLALALVQPASAEQPQPPAATPASAPGAPAATGTEAQAPQGGGTPASAGEKAPEGADARKSEMDAERNKRYQELRARAAEVGVDLPETPPWEGQRPPMPPFAGPSQEEREAMMKRREEMREKWKSMSPEERKAMREAHWQEMRERAAERGIEMPETPPWAAAEERYRAAQEQFEKYRKIVEEMSDEQREAARALLGRARPPAMPPMQPPAMGQGLDMGDAMPEQMPYGMPPSGGYPGYGPQGGYPGFGGPYEGGPMGPMGHPPMPPAPGGAQDQGPPPPAPQSPPGQAGGGN